jgi:oxamate amidohydrolase
MNPQTQFNRSRRDFLVVSAALAGSAALPIGGCAHAPAPKIRDKLARSTRGMVTSPHVLASEAGLEILAEGGNAIEAAIAMGSVLWVTYPHFCGIGGDAFCVIADRGGNVRTLLGVGQAAANPLQYTDKVPARGPGSCLTAGAAVDTWGQAFEFSRKQWSGKRSWKSLFKRSIEYAANGFPVTPSQRFWHEFRANEVKDWPGFARIFMPQGRIPEVGETFYQPELARTLERVANNGPREFYEGELAMGIADGLKKAGSPLSA